MKVDVSTSTATGITDTRGFRIAVFSFSVCAILLF